MDNASDPKQIKRAQKAALRAERERREVLVSIASTVAGRAWLWNQLVEANVFATTYQDNPGRMAFLEGRRAAGLQLLDDFMSASPDNFINAMREANGRRTESDLADAAVNGSGGPAAGQQPGSPEPGWEPEGQRLNGVAESFPDPGDEAVH